MLQKFIAVVALLATTIVGVRAQSAPIGSVRPGSVVVGLRGDGESVITACGHCLHAAGLSFSSASTGDGDTLDALMATFNVLDVRSVFRTELEESYIDGAEPKSLSAIRSFHDDRRAEMRARCAGRTARAPAGTGAPDLAHVYQLVLADHVDPKAAAAAFAADPHVAFAEPSYAVAAHFAPNDPFYQADQIPNGWGEPYENLWGLDQLGLEAAWDVSRGEGTVVGVVDTGVDYTHEDLAGNIWVNPGEDINGNGLVDGVDTCPTPNGDFNCIDDDMNGFVDDLRGWDFVTCNAFTSTPFGGVLCADPQEPNGDPRDEHGHGTHVAGIIAAVADNGLGIVGVAPESRILPARALNLQGAAVDDVGLARALEYSARMCADVINNSWGCERRCPRSTVTELAVHEAFTSGAMVIFSAGNAEDDVKFYFPQNMAETVAVAATTPDKQLAGYSNFGDMIDVAGPSGGAAGALALSMNVCHLQRNTVSLRSLITNPFAFGPACLHVSQTGPEPESPYLRQGGTSMAAPHVSGVAALILANAPVGFSSEDVRRVLRFSATDAEDRGDGAGAGAGIVNGGAAVDIDALPDLSIDSPAPNDVIDPESSPVTIVGTAAAASFDSYRLSSRRAGTAAWTDLGPRVLAPVIDGPLGSWDVGGLSPGTHYVRLVVRLLGGTEFDQIQPVTILGDGESIVSDLSIPPTGATLARDRVYWWEELLPEGALQIFSCEYDRDERSCERAPVAGAAHTQPSSPIRAADGLLVWYSCCPRTLLYCEVDPATGDCAAPIRHATPPAAAPFPNGYAADDDVLVWRDDRTLTGDHALYACELDRVSGSCLETLIAPPTSRAAAAAIWQNNIVWVDRRHGTSDLYYCRFDPATQTCPEARLTVEAMATNPTISGNRIAWEDSRNYALGSGSDVYTCALDPSSGACPETRLTFEPSNVDPTIWGGQLFWSRTLAGGGGSQVVVHDFAADTTDLFLPGISEQFHPSADNGLVLWGDGAGLMIFDLNDVSAVNRFPTLRSLGAATFPERSQIRAISIHAFDADGDDLAISARGLDGIDIGSLGCWLGATDSALDAAPFMSTALFSCSPPVDTIAESGGSATFPVLFEVSDGSLIDWQVVSVSIVDNTPSLAGRIALTDGTPVPLATVTLKGTMQSGARVRLTDMTNASGRYSFTGLDDGVYDLRAKLGGYLIEPRRISSIAWPSQGGAADFTAFGPAPELLASSSSITAVVVDSAGALVEGVEVFAKSNRSAGGIKARLRARTGRDGAVVFDHLPGGTRFVLKARRPKFGPYRAIDPRKTTLIVDPGTVTRLELHAMD